ncbi:hypothetical protein SAMN05216482_7651 [Streptomyces sp. PAN_FS17]|nr:hypothetical protein SAMN05216482_7651 [Streptomyces sp. PAN_FS17]
MLSRSRVRVRVNRRETCIWGTPTRSPIWDEFLHEPQVDDLPVPLIELVGQRGDGVEVLDQFQRGVQSALADQVDLRCQSTA